MDYRTPNQESEIHTSREMISRLLTVKVMGLYVFFISCTITALQVNSFLSMVLSKHNASQTCFSSDAVSLFALLNYILIPSHHFSHSTSLKLEVMNLSCFRSAGSLCRANLLDYHKQFLFKAIYALFPSNSAIL